MLHGSGKHGDNFCKDYLQEKVKVTLQNKDLWVKFHQHQTEMIITKTGRRMFPSLRLQVTGLDPNSHYCVLLEFASSGSCRYRYSASGGWTAAGTEESHSPHRIYVHPESPATGEHWMAQHISFGRLKLTNLPNPPPGHIVLSSMHKYQPRIIFVKTLDPRTAAWAPSVSRVFPETEFVAVTAYQNEKITKLKIDNNPFAKGFRENGQSKCKRKRPALEDNGQPLKTISTSEENKQRCSPSRTDFSEETVSIISSSSSSSSPELVIDRVSSVSPRSNHHFGNHFYQNGLHYFSDNSSCNQFGNDYYYPAFIHPYPTLYPILHYPYLSNTQNLPQNVNNSFMLRERFLPPPRTLTDFSIKAIIGAP